MGLFSWFFGDKEQKKRTVEPIEYQGFLLYPEPKAEGGQFRVYGRICKNIDGEYKEYVFIRSDLLSGEEGAKELMLQKAHIFIDQVGEKMFG